jgi:uncharacterized DUF497 family protein
MYRDDLFEWDERKDVINIAKHKISFSQARAVFLDPSVLVTRDLDHSRVEQRYFAYGSIGNGICTVRFTQRGDLIRIYGAGFWRKGRKYYEKTYKIT